MRKEQEGYLANGLCIQGCRRPTVTKLFCRECSDKQRNIQKQNVTNGLCKQGCGRPLVTKTLCRECADKIRNTQKQHRLNGLCESGCGRPLVTKAYCSECVFKQSLRHHKLSRSAVLARLALQGNRCPYTGKELVWGINASIEHDVPRSKGGTNDYSNIFVVDKRVNIAKSNMSRAEFDTMLKDIMDNCIMFRGETAKENPNDQTEPYHSTELLDETTTGDRSGVS